MGEKKIKDIENGSVIDHISAGKAIKVMDALGLKGKETVLIAINVSSKSMGSKDILKIENKFLSPEDSKKIAKIAPTATINIIKDSKVAEKRKVELPDGLNGLVKCPNPNCISNERGELVKSRLIKERSSYRCHYCERVFPAAELIG